MILLQVAVIFIAIVMFFVVTLFVATLGALVQINKTIESIRYYVVRQNRAENIH